MLQQPNQERAEFQNEKTGVVDFILCAKQCATVYLNDPRKNLLDSEGYFIYKTTDLNLPLNQWTRVNEQPIPPSGTGRGQYRIPRAEAEGIRGIYVTAVNALGFESDPGDIIHPPAEHDPRLLLKTFLEFRETTDEGQLIEAVTLPWFEILELLAKDPEAAFRIPDRKWEEIIAGAYHRAGFDNVTLTRRSGDYGRDVIAVKKGIGRVRVIDQVKAYKPGHLVTANDVRALLGVLQGDGASKGFLTTTSDFAPRLPQDPLIAKFIPSQLELINGQKLLSRLMELRRPGNFNRSKEQQDDA